jgi:predicted phage-related endonuclease
VRIIDCVQRSPEWAAARLGKLTGSVAHEMMATRKDKTEAAGRRNLRVRLALERITGRSLESDFVSSAMQQGIDREADACGLYEALTGRLLTSVGFIEHDTMMAGCSPDGIVGTCADGIVEAKSPIPATHLDYLRTGEVPRDYLIQVTHNLFITGAPWCDWLSFCPEFPEPLRVKLVRVVRDEATIDSYALSAALFLGEVSKEVESIRALAEAA